MSIQAQYHHRNPGLDVMRSTGLTLVVVQHSFLFTDAFFPKIRMMGLLSTTMLDLFFVLSGFLIASILYPEISGQRPLTVSHIKRFYLRRWFKTLPLYYLSMALFYLLANWKYYPAEDFSWTFLVFIQNLYSGNFAFMPHSYSMTIEEWFYFILPFAILLFAFLRSRFPFIQTWMMPLFWILLGVAFRWWIHHQGYEHWDINIRKSMLARIDAPIYGVLMYVLYVKYETWMNRHRHLLLFSSMVLFAALVFLLKLKIYPFYSDVLYFTLLPVAICMWFPWFICLKVRGWFKRITETVSKASYSIYLLHLPLLGIATQYLVPSTPLMAVLYYIIAVVLNMAIGLLVWYYIERPIMNLRERI